MSRVITDLSQPASLTPGRFIYDHVDRDGRYAGLLIATDRWQVVVIRDRPSGFADVGGGFGLLND